jgi:ribose transport system ATP-binding protein
MTESAGGDSELVLRVTRLSKTYATRVVDSVDWTLRGGRVHALLGGNGSGKSTLLKMIAGVVTPDPGGTVEIGGISDASDHHSPSRAAAAGLRFVHQDLGLVDDLPIFDNFALATRYPRGRLGSIDQRALVRHVGDQLRARGLRLDPRTPVSALRPAERTLVAIARALDGIGEGTATLVLDEPTASLPVDEVAHLFESVRDLRAAGHGVVFVSHRLSEVAEIADDVTILRDGRVVARGPIGEFGEKQILEHIAGHARVDSEVAHAPLEHDAAVVLQVDALSSGAAREVSLGVRAGEVVGVAGLVGSGRSSLLRGIFGAAPAEGDVSVSGVPVRLGRTRDAVEAGIAMVPEDRQREAAFVDRPVWENLSAVVLKRYRRLGRLSSRRERQDADVAVREYGIRAPSPAVHLAALSGGNQQKVILARWLRSNPKVILLDEPTQGVDAVARDEIHGIIRRATAAGAAVLVVSSDLDELEELSHRVIVLTDGRVTQELRGQDTHRGAITQAMHKTGTQQ